MSDVPMTPASLPALRSLVKALVIALGLALVLLVLVVLPAERNIDITGFGRAIGLTVLSAPKPEPAPQPPANGTVPGTAKGEDQATVDLPPGKGLEYKFRIRAGVKFHYSWTAEGGQPEYDFHGEPKGAPKDVFESYAAGKTSSVKGTLTTPFEGTHGWYWKNVGMKPIKVTLVTSGDYEILGVR
jgi:hypothetical protein